MKNYIVTIIFLSFFVGCGNDSERSTRIVNSDSTAEDLTPNPNEEDTEYGETSSQGKSAKTSGELVDHNISSINNFDDLSKHEKNRLAEEQTHLEEEQAKLTIEKELLQAEKKQIEELALERERLTLEQVKLEEDQERLQRQQAVSALCACYKRVTEQCADPLHCEELENETHEQCQEYLTYVESIGMSSVDYCD